MVDSVYVASLQGIDIPIVQSSSWVDTILALAMAVIAIADVMLTYLLFKKNRKDSSESECKTRKFELMQTLILNSNVDNFYKFFDEVTTECIRLKSNTDKATKDAVNKAIKSSLKIFRLEFITLVKVIDGELYDKMIKMADKLIDGITESIYDSGINLKHEPKFDEMVTQRISRCRVDEDAVPSVANLEIPSSPPT